MTTIENLLHDTGIAFTVLHDGPARTCPCCEMEARIDVLAA